jgi:lipoprotein-releasing system permease protein
MYKLTLILKYLRRKLGPMFASLAVMLCTAMVITVISVMGGFLTMLQDSAQQLTGDVSVLARSMTGFAHYEDLVEQIDALPEVEAVTPVVSMFGMVNIDGQTIGVNVMGIEPEGFSRIVRYEDTLQWSAEDMFKRYGIDHDKAQAIPPLLDLHAMSMTLKPHGIDMPGIVIGIEVNPWHYRDEQGQYDFGNSAVHQQATLTVLPLTESGAPAEIGPTYAKAFILNEFKSGLYDIDKGQVFVRFDVLQKLLGMDRREGKMFDPETGADLPGVSVKPARTSELVMRGAEGYTLEEVQLAVEREVTAFAEAHPDIVPPAVRSWRQRHAHFINAVKNEKGMVTFLFIIISVVAVVMVATTFYMTVLEKTRDIGVLRAVGASQAGVMSLFLGYGLAVGVVGSVLGLALALAIVWHLNEIQYWLANGLGVSAHYAWCAAAGVLIGALVGGMIGYPRRKALRYGALAALVLMLLGLVGAWVSLGQAEDLAFNLNRAISFKMWDPQTYFFDQIPDTVKFYDALFITLGAIMSSVIGALIPAVLAARLDPVEALRYE